MNLIVLNAINKMKKKSHRKNSSRIVDNRVKIAAPHIYDRPICDPAPHIYDRPSHIWPPLTYMTAPHIYDLSSHIWPPLTYMTAPHIYDRSSHIWPLNFLAWYRYMNAKWRNMWYIYSKWSMFNVELLKTREKNFQTLNRQ